LIAVEVGSGYEDGRCRTDMVRVRVLSVHTLLQARIVLLEGIAV
jgi:hypothetical protein